MSDVAVLVCAGYPPSLYWTPPEAPAWAVWRSPEIELLVAPYPMRRVEMFAEMRWVPRDVLFRYAERAGGLRRAQIERVLSAA